MEGGRARGEGQYDKGTVMSDGCNERLVKSRAASGMWSTNKVSRYTTYDTIFTQIEKTQLYSNT